MVDYTFLSIPDTNEDGLLQKNEILSALLSQIRHERLIWRDNKNMLTECNAVGRETLELDKQVKTVRDLSEVPSISFGFGNKFTQKLLTGVTFDAADINKEDFCNMLHDAEKQLATVPIKSQITQLRETPDRTVNRVSR